MEEFVRPISRLAAVELQDSELSLVSGGSATCATTDVYCCHPDGTWAYDATYPDPD